MAMHFGQPSHHMVKGEGISMPDLNCTDLFDLDTVVQALAKQLSNQYHVNLAIEHKPKSDCDLHKIIKKTAP